jgi:hypothetical protein
MKDTWRLYWREALGAALVLVTRILTAPKTPWENDEFLFAEAVRRFDPSNYHPHPPGYPLFVLLGKAFNLFVDDPWRALVIVNIIAAPIGFVALARAFRNWIDDADLAVAGALLYYFSASMLVHGTLALSDGVAMAFVALVILSVSEGAGRAGGALLGIWASAAIGCRPQLLIPIAPLLAIALWRQTPKQRVTCLVAFAFVSLMWFLPLVDAAGGVSNVIAYETKQAAYVASHDAAMSRGAKSAGEIVIRFLLHPWGSKYLTLPLLLCIALGAPAFARRWRALLPLIVFTAVQLAFELFSMDPADGARYSLPSMILIALVAALGFDVIRRNIHLRATPYIAAALFAAGAWAYVAPIVSTRARVASPPVQAAQFAASHFAPNTIVLYDTALKPHAEYLFARFHPTPIEKGLHDFYDRSDVPLVQFVDGGSNVAEAQTFAWPASDAYGKLTRNVYRRVTLDPVRPEERYLPQRGVYPLERTIDGDEWRWLERDAAIHLHVLAPRTALAFALSPDTPYDATPLAVNAQTIVVRKGEIARVVIPSAPDVYIVVQQAFSPATVLHNQDPRTLAVELKSVEQLH